MVKPQLTSVDNILAMEVPHSVADLADEPLDDVRREDLVGIQVFNVGTQ